MKTKVRILRPDMELNDATISFFYEKATFRSTMTAEIGDDISGTILQLLNSRTCDPFHEEMDAMLKKGDLIEILMVDDRDVIGQEMKSEQEYIQLFDVNEGSNMSGVMLGNVLKTKINLYEHVAPEVDIPFTLNDTKPAL